MGSAASKMCCGEGPLKMLMKEYGDDIGKFIVIEKVKNYIDQQISEIKGTIDGKSKSILGETFGEIEMREKELQNQFQEHKDDLNRRVPGGIKSLEKLKGEPIQQILGFNDFKDRFTELKNTVDTRFMQQKDNIFSEIDRKALEQKEKLDEEKPAVPLYDQLSDSHKKLVFREGEKVFRGQIEKQQQQMRKQLESLNIDKYLNIFKSIAPNNSLVGLVEGFKIKLQAITKLLRGGGSLGDIARDIF